MSAQEELEKLHADIDATAFLANRVGDHRYSAQLREWADRIAAIREGLGKAQRERAWIERKVYKNSAEHSAYLTARFTPQAGRNGISFEYDGHRWSYKWTSFDDAGDYDLLVRPNSTPPADSAQVLVGALEKVVKALGATPDWEWWTDEAGQEMSNALRNASEALAAHKSEVKG